MAVTLEDKKLAEKVRELLRSGAKVTLKLEAGRSKSVDLPKSISDILETTITFLAQGQNVLVLPDTSELTTQQAADILHVSRPHAIKLFETGKIPFRKVGKHRRALLADVLIYKNQIDSQRLKVLQKLTGEAQELELGY